MHLAVQRNAGFSSMTHRCWVTEEETSFSRPIGPRRNLTPRFVDLPQMREPPGCINAADTSGFPATFHLRGAAPASIRALLAPITRCAVSWRRALPRQGLGTPCALACPLPSEQELEGLTFSLGPPILFWKRHSHCHRQAHGSWIALQRKRGPAPLVVWGDNEPGPDGLSLDRPNQIWSVREKVATRGENEAGDLVCNLHVRAKRSSATPN